MEETQLLVHIYVMLPGISISQEREKGNECGKILPVDYSAVAMPNDLFSFNNFTLLVISLRMYLVSLLILWA